MVNEKYSGDDKGVKPHFLQNKKLLSKEEYAEFVKLRQIPERERVKRELAMRRKDVAKFQKQKGYERGDMPSSKSKSKKGLGSVGKRIERTNWMQNLLKRRDAVKQNRVVSKVRTGVSRGLERTERGRQRVGGLIRRETGRVAAKTTSTLRGAKALGIQGATQVLYNRQTSVHQRPVGTNKGGSNYSGRGRPRGSYDPRYAAYGGVYGYRKFMAQQRWREKQRVLAERVQNPRQLAVFRQIQAREEERLRSPEARMVPDTQGNIPTKNIHQEVNDYSNLFP